MAPTAPERADRALACILAGAIGDALGAGVEFLSLNDIRARGHVDADGRVTDYVPAYGRSGAITDDTQMTLFTLDGLVRASIRGRSRGIAHGPTMYRQSYLAWLATQDDVQPHPVPSRLLQWPAMHSRRAPGNTCLSALHDSRVGSVAEPINDSKGCGAVMRAAPIGFWPSWTPEQTFEQAAESGAITHGHPSGYLPAGVLAVVVARLLDGSGLEDALDTATGVLTKWPGHEETLNALQLGRSIGRDGLPSPELTETMGGGWVGEEALGIAAACAVGALVDGADLTAALGVAVTHSGDSDSTGSICGNLLGAHLGTTALPDRLLSGLELREEMTAFVTDALVECGPERPADDWGAAPVE